MLVISGLNFLKISIKFTEGLRDANLMFRQFEESAGRAAMDRLFHSSELKNHAVIQNNCGTLTASFKFSMRQRSDLPMLLSD